MRMRHAAVTAGLALGLMSGTAEASYLVNITQSAGGVHVTGVGEFNTTLLTNQQDANNVGPGVGPSSASLSFNEGPSTNYDAFITGPSNFGSGNSTFADTADGDATIFSFQNQFISVPRGYVSGNSLSSSLFFNGATFASLGLTPGTYNYTYSSQLLELAVAADVRLDFPVLSDTVTVQISTVPLPASAPMFGAALIGLAGIGYAAKRKKAAGAA